MGLFTFGKKVNPSKATATKNQQPAKSSKKHELATAPERPPANELKVLELAVGDKNLSLDIKSQATETSLMDDILGELSEQSHGENKWQPQDDLHSDVSLVLQLAHALELDNGVTSARKTAAETKFKPNITPLQTATDSSRSGFDNLFGADSIYNTGWSSNANNRASNWLNDRKHTTVSTTPLMTKEPSPVLAEAKRKPLVLDSDISDSEEDNDSEESDDEYRDNYKVPGRPSNLKLENKYKQKSVEENQQLVTQAMIDKMKDRHRAEARVALLRSKCLKHNEPHQQYQLSSSGHYHSMQTIPHSNSFMGASPLTPPTFPSSFSPHNTLPMAHSMQDLSSRLDEREPLGYSKGRASPMSYPPFAPPHQAFNRCHPGVATSTTLPEQMARPRVNIHLNSQREGITDFARPPHPQDHVKFKSKSILLSQQREKQSAKEQVLRKSRSFTNDQHNRRRYMDNDFPPTPDSPTSEPGFANRVYPSDSQAKPKPLMHKQTKRLNRLSSNNSSTTDDDIPNLPLTPSETSEYPSPRGSSSHYSDTESVNHHTKGSVKSKSKHIIKHTRSETNLRRPSKQKSGSDDDDDGSEHMMAMKEDNELKWHYRCYRQQNLYTSFSDYLAASQYQKMMLQQQQHIMYNPYPPPPMHGYPRNYQ